MSIVLMTANRWKIAEYRRFLARHAQTLLVESLTEFPAILASYLQTARAVLADESNIFSPEGDLVDPSYTGPARNICRLHAWVPDGTGKGGRRMSYIREVQGHFDGSRLRPGDAEIFDWDSAFTSQSGVTLQEMASVGLKNSAREQCLSAFAKGFLHHKEPKRLRWTPAEAAEWSTDARLLLDHPLYREADLSPPLHNALRFVVNQGIFFRSAKSRRDGNYWFPGLNGGLPYVPKADALHEGTYMFHDIMHQLMPDLVFDGVATLDHKRVYIAYRMMSEAVSLVLADMLFARDLAGNPVHQGYDFSTRRIFPLYQAIDPARRDDLRWLLRQIVGFVLRGDPGELPVETEAWTRFEAKYSRFFVADFQWTRMNWQNLIARSDMVRGWIELVHPEALRQQGIWFLSEVVEEVGRGLPIEALIERLFEQVWRRRLAPALEHSAPADVSASVSRGFRRWLTGQCALFARYAVIVHLPPLAHELAARVRDPRPFDRAEIAAIRSKFGDHVRSMAATGILSDDDAAIFPDLFPLFDPFFLRDYDEAQQEFPTVAQASAVAFA